MGLLNAKSLLVLCWTLFMVTFISFTQILSWLPHKFSSVTPKILEESTGAIVEPEILKVLKNISVRLDNIQRQIQKESFHPEPYISESGHKFDHELTQHLQEYNPLLPTDYEFHPDLTNLDQVSYFRNPKHTLGNYIYEHLNKKKNGYFIECGAYDGLWLSNTVWLERNHNWTGLLVEVDPNQASILKKRNRKAWVAEVCLSTEIYPTTLNFTLLPGGRTFIPNKVRKPEAGTPYPVKCYPLHVLLDAIGVSEIDYFSLDVEGVDLAVLKTIPWHRIKIKLISVEILKQEAGQSIQKYLEAVGYHKVTHLASGSEILMDDVYELRE